MSTQVTTVDKTALFPWQSLKSFTASTTLSEKVWRVVNNLIFVAAGPSLYAISSRAIRRALPALSYASHLVLALAVRKIVSTIIGYVVYPATLWLSKDELANDETQATQALTSQGFITQKITLYKSGVVYDATIIGHKDTLANGKWVMYALGNFMAMEQVMIDASAKSQLSGANTLLVNGPAVGRSKGFPTRYQKSAGFEAGLQFLEKEVKATHIAFKGISLGGGMMLEAVLAHEFDPNIRYLGISDRTFSSLSDIAAAILGCLITPVFYLSGTQLDSVSGAEKLKQLNIEHIIIQHTSEQHQENDGVIPDRASLASKLEPASTRTFLLSPDILHTRSIPTAIDTQLNEKNKAFFGQAPLTLPPS